MKRSIVFLSLVSLLLVSAFFLSGCACTKASQKSHSHEDNEDYKCGSKTACSYYEANSEIDISIDKKVLPNGRVVIGQPFTYEVKMTNRENRTAKNANLIETFPQGFAYKSSSPEGDLVGNQLIVKLGDIGHHETKVVKITGVATTAPCIKLICSAVTFDAGCVNVEVLEPKLLIAKEAPSRVIICDDIPLTFKVTNPGTGTTPNVKIADTLPSGLVTSDGKNNISLDFGNIPPGQTVAKTIIAKAQRTGTYNNKASASADYGLTASSNVTQTQVVQPSLTITKTGRDWQYIGKRVKYDITISNKGDGEARNLVVTDDVPGCAGSIEASEGAKLDGNIVVWNLGTLEPGQTAKVAVSYVCTKEGDYVNKANAVAYCADKVVATAATKCLGIPALVLEVVDNDDGDPVEVGNNTTYTITVRNQGSTNGTGIAVACTVPDGMAYVSSTGGSNAGNQVVFAPFSLAPGTQKVLTVTTKALKDGAALRDVAFRVDLESDQTQVKVMETESTHIYQ